MDNLGYFLLNRSNNDSFYRDILILFILVPVFKYLTGDITNLFRKFKRRLLEYYHNYKEIEFIGWESIHDGTYFYDYPLPMIAICNYLSRNNICKNVRYFNIERNGLTYPDDIPHHAKAKQISYLINKGENIKIADDIYLDFYHDKMEGSKETKNFSANWQVKIIIKSRNLQINELNAFIEKCIFEYEKLIEAENQNKIYHFIYKGAKRNNYARSLLSDYSDPNNMNYETFDNIFSDSKEMIIKDINRLKDNEYYMRTGNKRKKGYLFYGAPGCGKTSTVVAMALADRRHIIEISMSRLKTNEDLEEIFNLSEINGVKFNKNQIILLFDEIDNGGEALGKRDKEFDDDNSIESFDSDFPLDFPTSKKKINPNDESPEKKPKEKETGDKINLGCVLSRLDGVGSYNGLIIVATTNCKDNLSPALYRNGRLNPVLFDYISREQLAQMIEKFYAIKLTDNEKSLLPDKCDKIPHSSIRKFIEDYEDNYKGLINYLDNYKKTSVKPKIELIEISESEDEKMDGDNDDNMEVDSDNKATVDV